MNQFDYTTVPLLKQNASSITGPALIYPGQSGVYTITNFDTFHSWTVSVDKGTVSRVGDQITLQVDVAEPSGTVNMTVTRNGIADVLQISVQTDVVVKPTVVTPINGAVDVIETPTITLSTFATFPADSDTEQSVSVRILNPDDSVAWQLLDQPPGTDFTVPAGVLLVGTSYRPQGRYKGNALGYSEWSDLDVSFTTAASYGPAAGAVFEGDIVIGQMGGDWLLVAPASKRALRKWAINTPDIGGIANLAPGQTDPKTGKQNTDEITNATFYPAAGYCRSELDKKYDLPNCNELELILSNRAEIDAADVSVGSATMSAIDSGLSGQNEILSSTEYVSDPEGKIICGSGTVLSTCTKLEERWVIPVRRIPV